MAYSNVDFSLDIKGSREEMPVNKLLIPKLHEKKGDERNRRYFPLTSYFGVHFYLLHTWIIWPRGTSPFLRLSKDIISPTTHLDSPEFKILFRGFVLH